MRRGLIVLALLLLASPALAVDKYVRVGGNNGNSGNDWTNAYQTLQVCETNTPRGNTCWVGNGSMAGASLDTATSGTTLITIKKATIAAHGVATGWSDSYAAQASFGDIFIGSDYWVFDGVYRNESNWNDSSAYGFNLTDNAGIAIDPSTHCSHHVTIAYTDAGGADSTTFSDSNPDQAIYIPCYVAAATTAWTISHNRLHNVSHYTIIQAFLTNSTIEYNWFGDSWGKEAIRGQIIFDSNIIRYNVFWNACGQGGGMGEGCTAEIAAWGEVSNWSNNEIYGNLFAETRGELRSGGVIVVGGNGTSWLGSSASNTLVYNNTFYGHEGFVGTAVLLNGGSGNVCRNNLLYSTTEDAFSCSTSSNNTEVGSNPFVSVAAKNLHLSGATAAGFTLGSPYTTDMDGCTRGADGSWDLGALEYNATSCAQGGGDVTAPVVTITAPTSSATYATNATPLTTLAGTASDAVGVSSCTWTSDRGGSGSTTGTTSWSIPSVPLLAGVNVITVSCVDAASNSGNDLLTVTYAPLTYRLRVR